MKFVTFRSGHFSRPGALLRSGKILDLRKALEAQLDEPLWTIADLLGRGEAAVRAAAEAIERADADPALAESNNLVVSADSVQLLSPVGPGASLWTIGMLYPAHAREMKVPVPKTLMLNLRSAQPIIGSGEAIVLPTRAPDMVDYEGELAVVIGKLTYRVDPESAMEHVAGYTIYNDVGAREYCQPFIDEMAREGGPTAATAAYNLFLQPLPTTNICT